jgi:ABC-type uncharacterized transport system auxiliary subunit
MLKTNRNTMGKAPARSLAGAATLIVLAALSGCGSGGSDSSSATPPSTLAASDTFLAQVATVVATAPDDAEAMETDSIAVTSPEDTEPEPVT